MELNQARTIAERIVSDLAPGCRRIEIAGGIRRGKLDPHDIEIIVSPDLRQPRPQFGMLPHKSIFEAVLSGMSMPDEDGFCLVRIMGADKYKKFAVSFDGGHTAVIKLDLFIVTHPAQFGVQYLIRTGPAEFSQWMVTHRSRGGALPDYLVCKDGALHVAVRDEILETPDECDVFQLCGMSWIEPCDRVPSWRRAEHVIPVHQLAN